ncbi:MAG: CoA transferase, partial [Pseudomonadota bacterium]|nr:CoA transferase [Pseudomonadota bacterium]
MQTHPLDGVRVLNLGGSWAGRVAAMLLADQGAEVIEIDRPGREEATHDAALGRGKTVIAADLKDPATAARIRELAAEADIVLDNLGAGRAARFGLSPERLRELNPALVHVSMPGFAAGSEMEGVPAYEGVIAAAVGVFTDIHALGPVMGGRPIFSSVPMASAYGGVHAAIAATLAYFDRLKTGQGRALETPLADALLSAMALLIMKVENQPQRFDLPPIDKAMREVAFPLFRDLADDMDPTQSALVKGYLAKFARPQFGNYVCADGRQVFINAVDHVRHARACLDVLGLLDDLIAEGMVVGSPYEEGGAGNNISSSSGLSAFWVERMRTLMTARFRTRPAQEWEARLQAAGVPVTVVRTTTEWLDLPQMRDGGNVERVEDPRHGGVAQPGRYVSIEGAGAASPDLRPRRIGAASDGWTSPRREATVAAPPGAATRILARIKVLALPHLNAGPPAAPLQAAFGAA